MPDNPPTSPRTLNDWLEAIAAPVPSPAGGSAAALAAGLAAALVEMVAGLTRNREKYAPVHEQARAILERAKELREAVLALAVRDAEVFAQFARALELPEKSEAERATRLETKRRALRDAAEVQLELLRRTLDVADLAGAIAETGLASALGDATTAAFLAGGAARSAYWAARSDLAGMDGDPEIRSLLESALATLERVEAVEWRVRQLLSERVP